MHISSFTGYNFSVAEPDEIKRKLGEVSKQLKKTQESLERLRERNGSNEKKKTRRIPKVPVRKKP